MPTLEKPAGEKKLGAGRTVRNLVIGLVVLVAGLALIFTVLPAGTLPGIGAAPASSAPTDPSLVRVAPVGAAAPTHVSIPSISAESSLVPTGLKPDGSLAVPPVSQPRQASWYDQSPTPGEKGPAVILGHVNGNGQRGVFADLNRVRGGQQVFVDRADGTRAVFKVSRVDTFKKDAFPTDLVYNNTPNSQLRLITCGGQYDRANRNYLSNVIVYADLVDVQRI
jgi:LPXTG-site transpeptidase (sortase) family protein